MMAPNRRYELSTEFRTPSFLDRFGHRRNLVPGQRVGYVAGALGLIKIPCISECKLLISFKFRQVSRSIKILHRQARLA